MTAPANLFDDGTDFGTDVNLVTDLAPIWGIASGRLNLANAIARRLSTARGLLFYDQDYGFDVTALVGASFDQVRLSKWRGDIKAECEKDPRVSNADVTLTPDFARNELTIEIAIETETGPFDLVLRATQVTVALLAVDGVVAAAQAATDAATVIIRRGEQGPPGPAGGGGGGGGAAGLSVDHGFTEVADGTGAEVVVDQYVIDFDAYGSPLALKLNARILSASGTATYKVRLGGTDRGVDGTILATMTTGSATYVSAEATASVSNPTGRGIVKITMQSSGAGVDAKIKDWVLTW